jgi:hypothetical protein
MHLGQWNHSRITFTPVLMKLKKKKLAGCMRESAKILSMPVKKASQRAWAMHLGQWNHSRITDKITFTPVLK